MADAFTPNPALGFIRLANVALFSNALRARGVDPAPAFEAHGLSSTSVDDENVFVHADVVYGLTNAFADLVPDRFLGVHVGDGFAFSDWPPFVQAAAHATTLIEFLTRYIDMVPTEVSSVKHSLLVEPGTATYRVTRPFDPAVPPVQVTGFGCAQYIRVMRAVTGPHWDPSRVVFKSKYVSCIPETYQDIRVERSDHPGLEISFPVDWLFERLQLDVEIANGRSPSVATEVTVVTALRSALVPNLARTDLTPEMVAGFLGLEADLLIKALRHAKTTLPKEIKRLKIDRAKADLADSDMTISDIGAGLGYRDHAHFTRFFRSQTGMTPMAFRKQNTRER